MNDKHEALRAAAQAATPGPWTERGSYWHGEEGDVEAGATVDGVEWVEQLACSLMRPS